ncbi:MAG TPA: (deoxy)nucleoside triphosphate pyrophosphohydrolase [Planctomycetota bacterium]|jgi:8-oxo-dGTP diphosphatase|nr:(deoxy)nucleoside triphosphate pyrophosphohydrolase [Planctomycetota bacterium]
MPSPPQPGALTIAVGVIERGGRYLVAKRPDGAHAGGTWEFPGGKSRPGEDIDEALRREVLEETGLSFQDAILLHVEEHAYAEREVRLHFFLCRDVRGEPDGREGQEVRWVTLAELLQLEVPAGNRRFLAILADQTE